MQHVRTNDEREAWEQAVRCAERVAAGEQVP